MAGQTAPLENLAICPVRVQQYSDWDSLQRICDVALIVLTLPVWAPLLMGVLAIKLLVDGRPVAKMKLESMGVKIDRLTVEQEHYLSSWSEGT